MTNIIPGQMKGVDEGLCVVEVPFGEIHCRPNENAAGPGKVLVLLRPESLKVSTLSPAARKNVWIGEIKEKTFLGDFIDCEISCDGFTLRAKLDPYSELAEGDKVFVSVDPARCAVIPIAE